MFCRCSGPRSWVGAACSCRTNARPDAESFVFADDARLRERAADEPRPGGAASIAGANAAGHVGRADAGRLESPHFTYAVLIGFVSFSRLLWLDASQAIFEPPPENWRRPPGQPRTTWMKNIHDDPSSLDLRIHESRDLMQNRPLWRLVSLHSTMHS